MIQDFENYGGGGGVFSAFCQADKMLKGTIRLLAFCQVDKVLKAKIQLLALCQLDKMPNAKISFQHFVNLTKC